MKERLAERKKPTPAKPMAARAVSLCEGCPMVKFCVVKDTGVCPSPEVAMGGGDCAVAPKVSYRKELMDDSIDTVMAKLQPASAPKPKALPPRAIARPKPAPQPAAIPRSATKPKAIERAPRRQAGESMPDVLADILLSTFATKSLSTARSK